jgi:nucleoside diphosphate kinase
VEWSELTRIALKAQLYERETYFREGLSDAELTLGADLAKTLRQAAFLVVKPDGLTAGKLATVLGFLDEQGFTVVGARFLRLRRLAWRELWRYQLTSATLDRLAVNELVLEAGPALALALYSSGDHDIPATVRLSLLKGSAMTPGEVPGTLRYLLRQPNRVLSFVHAADEPADLVRELGLLFPGLTRQRLLEGLRDRRPAGADRRTLAQACAAYPPPGRELDSAVSLAQVTAAIRAATCPEPGAITALLRDLDRMRTGQPVSWRPFGRRLAALGIPLDSWDVAVLGSSFIQYDEPGTSKLLQGPDPEAWKPKEIAHGASRSGQLPDP